MKHWNSLIFSVCFLTLSFLLSAGNAYSAKKTEQINVTLFGQPCTMTGPFSRAVLTQIHEISPEKIRPDFTTEQMKKIQNKASGPKVGQTQVDAYRDHLRKRLSAKIAFNEVIDEAKKKSIKTPQAFKAWLINLKENIPAEKFDSFHTEARALFEKNAETWNESTIEGLREKYENLIEPDTEEEFHKAIRVANIQYLCAFDEGSDPNNGRDEEED